MFALPTLAIAFATSAVPSPEPTILEMQDVLRQGLPYLEREGVAWIEERKCVSCHVVPFLIWGMQGVNSRGFAIEGDKLGQWRRWSMEQTLTGAQKSKDNEFAAKNAETISQLILARGYAPAHDGPYPELTSLLLAGQRDDGSWAPGGQTPSQKRPLRETTEVTTMWALHALASVEAASVLRNQISVARQRALNWLKDSPTPQSTEWFVMRLLLASDSPGDQSVESARQQLLAEQNPDGGWAWLCGEESDAFATGQSLYALAHSGISSDHPAVRRAWRFLRDTQREDGSWRVRSTKKAKQKQAILTSNYWGSAWAVIGLARSMPK